MKRFNCLNKVSRKEREEMTRKKIVLLTIFLILTAATIITVKVTMEKNELLREKISYFQKIEENEKQWIMSNQTENGAILTYEKKIETTNWVNPYFANLAASALMEGHPTKEQRDSVRRYLSWYLKHINSSQEDPINGGGTIYDYDITVTRTGEEKSISKREYDSVDSYASTFLKAASDYVRITQDTKWLAEYSLSLQRVANALLRCINAEGITLAKTDYPIYYLMDNCETNAGLKAMKVLQKQGVVFSQEDEVKGYLEKNSDCVKEGFWRNGEYIIGLDEDGEVLENNKSSIYPKTIAQIYPIAWQVLDKKEERAEQIYQSLCDNWQWEKMDYRERGGSQSYWPVLAFVGALLGDEDRVETYIENYMNVVEKDHGYPIHIDDAAWIIKTCEEMKSYYQNKIFTLLKG